MKRNVFVSYSHKQKEWVRDRLVPCLEAGGVEALIDYKCFKAGRTVLGQIDSTQDKADLHILVLSPDYLNSGPCQHEMDRAIALDPTFQHGIVLPVIREDCPLPENIAQPNPLYIDLRDDTDAKQWDVLMEACAIDLGTSAVHWLEVRDEIRQHLRNARSVSLLVEGKPKWRELIENLRSDNDPAGPLPAIAEVDLQRGAAVPRRGLVEEIIHKLGGAHRVPPEPEDLLALDRYVCQGPKRCLVLRHFDCVLDRPHYEKDFFGALHNLITDEKKLLLLVQSRTPLPALLPKTHPLSPYFNNLKTAKLKGYTCVD